MKNVQLMFHQRDLDKTDKLHYPSKISKWQDTWIFVEQNFWWIEILNHWSIY